MDQKPPLLEQLTAAEILEYWSLLTQDQRNDFLERKLAALLEPAERQKGVKPPEPAESFFDRFAGIFHAFSCLEEHVLDALKRKSVKDARYRLLGKSYDSLPTLARQVKESADKDAVVGYVTLLRASEVFRNLRRQIQAAGIKTDFLEANKSACSEYERKWAADCEEVKSRITLEGSHDPATFFAWYEKQFAKPVQVAAD